MSSNFKLAATTAVLLSTLSFTATAGDDKLFADIAPKNWLMTLHGTLKHSTELTKIHQVKGGLSSGSEHLILMMNMSISLATHSLSLMMLKRTAKTPLMMKVF